MWRTTQCLSVCLIKNTCSINFIVYFSEQILHPEKDSTAKRKKRTPRVFRLLSRVIRFRTSNTYQPKVEALAQSWNVMTIVASFGRCVTVRAVWAFYDILLFTTAPTGSGFYFDAFTLILMTTFISVFVNFNKKRLEFKLRLISGLCRTFKQLVIFYVLLILGWCRTA